ncbi:MAG TPA: hypothetical protein ENJ31_03410 [Anaerolineae bacterium]|nr:hypothetical protein [Anaerolineae bacterium]
MDDIAQNTLPEELLPGRIRKAENHLRLAGEALANELYEEARGWAERAVKQLAGFANLPDEAQALVKRASEILMQCGNTSTARESTSDDTPPSSSRQEGTPQDDKAYQAAAAFFHEAVELHQRPTKENLMAAVEGYDKAIELGRKLDLKVPEYRNNLASAFYNKGLAQQALGTPRSLADAVESYDEAIELRRELDLTVPEYHNDLAASYSNKGTAQAAHGTPRSLADAVQSFNEAIKLWRELDLSVPQYRNGLATAYSNKGLAQKALGTPRSLADAVRSFNEAIELGRELDLTVPEYRNGLATAFSNKGNAQQTLGTPGSLADAVQSFNEAIKLRRELDLTVPQYRNDLAAAYSNKGLAQQALGTPRSLADAVQSFNEAIKLRRELDLSVPQYRNDLAGAYSNKGLALAVLGTPQSLADAVRSFNEAIELRRELDLTVPQYRNDLAAALSNKGNAQRALGTPRSLADAVESHDEAIKLRRKLDLNVPQYRNDLATALSNKGLAQKALGTPRFLADALRSFNEAIELRRELDLKVPEYCNDLAAAYNNKGNAQQALGTPQSLADALEQYDAGLELLEAVPRLKHHAPLVHLESWFILSGAKSQAQYRLGRYDEAADVADEALSLAQELETRGQYRFRHKRETLFKQALEAYLAAGQAHFLPEIIFDHLDPGQAGHAADSVAMHRAAIETVQSALARLLQSAGNEKQVSELEATAKRLAEIRARYLGGSATAARLRAEGLLQRGDPGQAERELRDYMAARPRDPEGALNLAAFFVKQQNDSAALEAYQRAATVLILAAPRDAEREAISGQVGEIAGQMMALKLFAMGRAEGGDADNLMRQSDELLRWLEREFTGALFTPPDGTPLDTLSQAQEQTWRKESIYPALEATWAPFAEQRRGMLEHYIQERNEQALSREWERMRNMHQAMTQRIVAQLSTTWQGAAEAMLYALNDIWQSYLPRWQETPADARGDMEAEVCEAVARAVEEANQRLAACELEAETAVLKAQLGDIWEALAEQERRHLACAYRCLKQDELMRYAGLDFGLAVEWSLLKRIFEPLQQWCQDQIPGDRVLEDAVKQTVLGEYFLGRRRGLSLGLMSRAFVEALRAEEGDPSPQVQMIRSLINSMPRGAQLFPASGKQGKQRGKNLDRICELRNRCAHPGGEPPEAAALQALSRLVVEDEENGFYRYFGQACLEEQAGGNRA